MAEAGAEGPPERGLPCGVSEGPGHCRLMEEAMLLVRGQVSQELVQKLSRDRGALGCLARESVTEELRLELGLSRWLSRGGGSRHGSRGRGAGRSRGCWDTDRGGCLREGGGGEPGGRVLVDGKWEEGWGKACQGLERSLGCRVWAWAPVSRDMGQRSEGALRASTPASPGDPSCSE